MITLNKILETSPYYILAINRDSELSYASDELADHYLAEMTKQYEYSGACIAFTSECLVSINDKGRVTIEQYDTSPDSYSIYCTGIADMPKLDGYLYDSDKDGNYDLLMADHIVYDEPDFMMVEYY